MVTSPFSPETNRQTYNPSPEKTTPEALMLQMGEAVLAATETVNALASRLDEMANQVEQQGYQIFALTEEVQNLTTLHQGTLHQLETLMAQLQSR